MSGAALPVDRCHEAILKIERDIADVSNIRWRARVRDELRGLRRALAQPDPSRGDTDLAELGFETPRLAYALRRLRAERECLTDLVDALIADSSAIPMRNWEHAIQDMLVRVRAYRREVSRVLHEAYVVDIGGEM